MVWKRRKHTLYQSYYDLIHCASPLKSATYLCGPKAREVEELETKCQLAAGALDHSNAKSAAPVVFVPNMDGRLRFCVPYRKLNTMIFQDSYPLPRVDECVDSLGEAHIFSTMDSFSVYWQIDIAKKIFTKRRSIVTPEHSNISAIHPG